MNENIYFVDVKDKPTGEFGDKLKSHNLTTKLHAAFSCYVFNKEGKFLVTQRAHSKKVWPGVWTNSCCGHPYPDESREDAIRRRLKYELGLEVSEIQVIMPKYIYKTPPYKGVVEHEYCPVFTAVAESEIIPNPKEVGDYKWVDWEWYVKQLEKDNNDYTDLDSKNAPKWSWWAKDQLEKLKIVNSFK